MGMRVRRRVLTAAAITMVAAIAATGCGSPQEAATAPGGDTTPYKVGLVYSQSGALATLRQAVRRGLQGRPRLRHQRHQQGRRATRSRSPRPTTPATRPRRSPRPRTSSARATRSSPAPRRPASRCRSPRSPRRTRCCSSPARPRPTALTGVNSYTFRSGRQSYQDVLTAKSFIGDPAGKKVLVFAQDTAFGQANVARRQGRHRRRRRHRHGRPGAGRRPPSSPRSPSRR